MSSIIARGLIFLICAVIQYNTFPITSEYIIIMLSAIIISCINIMPEQKAKLRQHTPVSHLITTAIVIIYCICAVFIPELLCYLPLLIFDIYSLKLTHCAVIYVLCLLCSIMNINPVFFITLCILSLIAGFVQHLVCLNNILTDRVKSVRDSSKEHELLIEENNKSLRKNQDAQVYMATLKERNRIAREIHDNVGHLLTRSILQVGAIKTINKASELSEPLNDLHTTLNTAMASIRSSVHDLYDESIDMNSAIKEIVDSVDEFSIKLDYDVTRNVPKDIKYCFISVVKEAVNNTLKHSNASNMDIIVREHPAFYQLMIEDDGTNIDIKPATGIGLKNITERVNSLNGNIKISTDSGFKILISIMKDMG